jgi:hypothetical protein
VAETQTQLIAYPSQLYEAGDGQDVRVLRLEDEMQVVIVLDAVW